MTTFLFAAAGLCALLLAIVLPSLWRGGRGGALALLLLLPVAGAGLYGLLGTPAALDPARVRAPETREEAIAQLEAHLAEEPGSVEGWVLLARNRAEQQRWPEARDAFAKAHTLLPDDPDLMVEYADAQMRAAPDGRFPDAATAMLENVVAANPRHQRALFYLGAQRFQAGRAADAAALWEQLLPLVEASTANVLRPQIDLARAQAGLPPLPADAGVAATGPTLVVAVDLSAELAARRGDDDVLFVFARRADGSGPPVAVRRIAGAQLPAEINLSDADSLMPTQKLSEQAQVLVVARLSRSGDAGASAGDLESAPVAVAVADGATVALTIDRVHP